MGARTISKARPSTRSIMIISQQRIAIFLSSPFCLVFQSPYKMKVILHAALHKLPPTTLWKAPDDFSWTSSHSGKGRHYHVRWYHRIIFNDAAIMHLRPGRQYAIGTNADGRANGYRLDASVGPYLGVRANDDWECLFALSRGR